MSIRLRIQPYLRRAIFFCVGLVVTVGILQISGCSVPSGPSGAPAGSGKAAEQVNRGVALQRQKDFDGAIAAYREALAAEPDNALAHYNLASALADKKDFDGAIAEYRESLRLKPDLTLAHFGLGYALASKGDKAAAMAELRAYLQAPPEQGQEATRKKAEEDIRTLEAAQVGDHVNQGIALEKKGDIDGAIKEYRLALAADPNNAVAHYNLGSALSANEDYDGALAEYRQALTLKPDLVVTHLRLAYALAAKGDKAGAIAELKTYLEQAPAQGAEQLKQKAQEDIRKLEGKR